MANNDWESKIDYLKTTRTRMWNDDYFEFLVKSVWKLNSPKRIVDFGCGYGYLGMKLLPLLPEGSTYTGVDIGEKLIDEARKIFSGTRFETEFINIDLMRYAPQEQYDIAICQTVLRHIPQSKTILSKMVDSIVSSGMVICIEVNREIEEAGTYIHGINNNSEQKSIALKKQWQDELATGGRDYLTGIKVPIYMEELGLKNVGVRLNDYVDFISKSNTENFEEEMSTFMRNNGINDICIEHFGNLSLLQARGLIISYGSKQCKN